MKKDENWDDWCELYEYFKNDILHYPEDLRLPRYVVLRLQGLAKGQFMANKDIKPMASYEYKTITLTMKLSKAKIDSYITRNKHKFADEQHKINGVFVIIEKEINTIALRLKQVKKTEQKLSNLKLEHQANESATYKKKEEKRRNKNTEDLW